MQHDKEQAFIEAVATVCSSACDATSIDPADHAEICEYRSWLAGFEAALKLFQKVTVTMPAGSFPCPSCGADSTPFVRVEKAADGTNHE
jgi:hypothetical protein